MHARITVTYIAKNVCEPDDLDADTTFEQMVRSLINSEGIEGIADLERIVSIVELEEEEGA